MRKNDVYMEIEGYINYLYDEIGVRQRFYTRKIIFEKMYEDNSYKDKIMCKNDTIYISKKWVDDSIKLYRNSVSIGDAVKEIIIHAELNECIDKQLIRNKIIKKCKSYIIHLINQQNTFISKIDLSRIIDGVKELKLKKCMINNEIVDMINVMFMGITFTKAE